MNEIKYPLNNFDLKAFIGSEVSFIRDQGTRNPSPVTAIPVVENDGSTPHLYEHAADRTPHDELIDEQKNLYFPFSNSNNGEPVLCADGRVYTLPQGKEEAN